MPTRAGTRLAVGRRIPRARFTRKCSPASPTATPPPVLRAAARASAGSLPAAGELRAGRVHASSNGGSVAGDRPLADVDAPQDDRGDNRADRAARRRWARASAADSRDAAPARGPQRGPPGDRLHHPAVEWARRQFPEQPAAAATSAPGRAAAGQGQGQPSNRPPGGGARFAGARPGNQSRGAGPGGLRAAAFAPGSHSAAAAAAHRAAAAAASARADPPQPTSLPAQTACP